MARASYGTETKKRSLRLLAALLAYANEELDCNEAALDALRPQIQTRWQSENRLVVRTKVRYLLLLTGLQSSETPLNAEQIKEALKRFADFLEILEDNRPTRGGSENWHFTLHLWCDRHNIQGNLQQFDTVWESRRVEKRGGLGRSVADSPQLPINNWQEICRTTLEAQNQQRLTTNPLTCVDGVTFIWDDVYVPLGLVERKHRDRHSDDVSPVQGSTLYETEETEIKHTFTPDEFLQKVLYHPQSSRIAILGEPGAGKTTLLQKIASWVLDNTQDLVVWISLADLQGKTLEDYLIQDWLRVATRKRQVSPEIEEAFCEQFNQGQVWLLLDAVDEMAMESSHALTKIANFLTGWVADAKVVLTCRLNVWDSGKNVLETFDTYRNLNFTYGDAETPGLVEQFISHWFQENPGLGESLRAELNQRGRGRIKDTVKNPLRLALLCRIWGLRRGGLPNTKAMLYEQFVEAIYQWKEDRFPTNYTTRQELNKALGKLALLAISQEKTRFRLSHSFVSQVLGASDEGMFKNALQLGWLNQVGISETQGEKVYAFYHPTFQEYFAALAINDWRFFFSQGIRNDAKNSFPKSSPFPHLPLSSYRIFDSEWREVILLWLGRNDIPQLDKEEFLSALIDFPDNCGGFYSYQAYFLAAIGISEFVDCTFSNQIVSQLIKWRFGYFHPTQQKWYRFPSPIVEGARVALLKTDRRCAINLLQEFVKTSQNDFDTWNAAYSLGKVFDPGNKVAIAALEQLVRTIRHETLRWQAADSLGKVAKGNSIAIAALIKIIESTNKDSTRRKAAYSLGKIEPGNQIAICTLEKIITTTNNNSLREQAAESLRIIAPDNAIALGLAPLKIENITIQKTSNTSINTVEKSRTITNLIEGIISTQDEDTKRRRACRLAKIDPGNLIAFDTLLRLVKSAANELVRKRTADNFKKILLDEQMPALIAFFKDCFSNQVRDIEMEQFRHCYKLVWHCAEKMTYLEFYQAWYGEIE
ncbi:MAG: HEAT repeat domain-containing protein [Cyanomargarita calcarea GSE-NOS-MK-12-04C]|jgi:predicted NACHT family NTPase|uniref:HEAT repeat domain-containing protein n=1 Tax=Cyanomargarita calcarea GSE-NOS-MK-12-04C TaxID=2839659 RepID=A0A951QUC4_9CYAN|nr:HEAT repeat domain-containing protein [Cyanomargarita calcarea GSE-NOS-MK-12-04C]